MPVVERAGEPGGMRAARHRSAVLRMDDGLLETPSTAWLVPFLLLDLRESDAYGHELRWRMSDHGFHERRPGTVYWILRQIEGEGMVFCDRDGDGYETSERRYSITEAGESYLEFWAESLVRYREEIDLFSEVYERTGGGGHK
ncbi:MAG: hypothetical protein AVDCRST_MAG14-2793 [uncultured Rubrobacteraceae bacterium]|uniref:Transcription regulator PadR N-terminal domain-containing protein n=1 Tax=uncultured Rubrobacteraceae bacterium TaxID=349277 RepID=A0A6J4R6S6_9ACTN|nr:MAG: hypothetical protein AVDCRST_MAG14-2793 [uncultured Rubrobacteraceae bacterium]